MKRHVTQYAKALNEYRFALDAVMGTCVRALAKRHGIGKSQVSEILLGRSRPHIARWIARCHEQLGTQVPLRVAVMQERALSILEAELGIDVGADPEAGPKAEGESKQQKGGSKKTATATDASSHRQAPPSVLALAKDILDRTLGKEWSTGPFGDAGRTRGGRPGWAAPRELTISPEARRRAEKEFGRPLH